MAVLGSIPHVLVQDAFPLRHNDRHQVLAGHIHRGAAHVDNRLDRQEQAHTGQRQPQRGKREREHHRGAGGAGGGRRTKH